MLKSKAVLRRAIATIALAGALVPVMGGAANALPPITCTAAGTVTFVNGDPDTWTVGGRGSCQGDFEGTYFLDFSGTGTSDTLGVCDSGLVVQNLDIAVVATLTNAQTNAVKVIPMHWASPITTYPIVTPFLITDNDGGLTGAGAFFNHIFLICTGPTVAQFDFVIL